MDFCERIIASGDTSVPQGAVGVNCWASGETISVSLPSSVRGVHTFENNGGHVSVSLNSGLVLYKGTTDQINGGLPSSLKWLDTHNSWNGNNQNPNNGLMIIGDSAFEGGLCMSGNHNSNIPKSVKFIGERAYRNSLINGTVKCKAPFVAENAFEYCSGVTSFNFDVSDVENTNSYILNPFFTYKEYCDGYHDGYPGPPIADLPLKSIFLKGYEWVYLNMMRNGNLSTIPRLNKIEIIGNGNTKVGWGTNEDEDYNPIKYNEGCDCTLFANEVIIGDGVKTLSTTIMAVVPNPDPIYPDIPETANPDRNNKAARNTRIRLGKDIENIFYVHIGFPTGEHDYCSFHTERLEITKDDGIMLPNETRENINNIFGGCTAIYVPSKVYQAYLAADNWSGMASRINSY